MNFKDIVKKHTTIEWRMEPFPHAIIDNFFPQDIFDKISDVTTEEVTDIKRENTTSLELNKSEFGLEGSSQSFRIPVNLMGKEGGTTFFSDVISAEKIITLASYDDFYGYYPYHQSTRNGLLGAHVDHSSLDKNFHFANSIFYSHKVWEKEWKGETILFGRNGMVPKVYIEPKPNRMIFFIHSNQSFHGVNTIKCPEGTTRNTYYMDYYLAQRDIPELRENIKNMGYSRSLNWTYHPTTFIPFFPLGMGSFTTKGLKESIKYLKSYVAYLFFRINTISKLRFRYFDQIRNLKKKLSNQ